MIYIYQIDNPIGLKLISFSKVKLGLSVLVSILMVMKCVQLLLQIRVNGTLQLIMNLVVLLVLN